MKVDEEEYYRILMFKLKNIAIESNIIAEDTGDITSSFPY